jgi:hypothetical protein
LGKEELPEDWKESIIVPIYKKGDEIYCSNYRGMSFCQLPTKFYPTSSDHIFCIRQILEKKWTYNKAVHQVFREFKKACDPINSEVQYNIVIESGIPMKLARLIKNVSE